MSKFLSVLLGLWVALAGTVSAGPTSDPVHRAVTWLRSQQLPDGSFGLLLSDGAYMSSASATADVIYALTLVGEDPAGPAWTRGGQSALDALALLAPGYVRDAGQAGKIARAVALAGGDPRSFGGLNLVQTIRQAYDPATGRYDPDLLYRHTLAIEGLLVAGEMVPTAAFTALLQAQRPNGGWFWSFDGDQTDVDTTGRVLQLLASQVGVQALEARAKAVRYLPAEQQATGDWGVGYLPGPPNANSTALVVAGLRAAGCDPQASCFCKAGRGALDALLAYQEPSGAFVYIRQPGREESRLMATVDVLSALAQPLAPAAVTGLTGCCATSRWLEQGAVRKARPAWLKDLHWE